MDQNENWKLEELPLPIDVETKAVLKSLPSAHAALAELKGIASTIPNQIILINTLGLQEAKDSSAIENIITTHDDLFKSELNLDSFKSLEAKEVQNYISALKKGFELIQSKGFITNSVILEIQKELEGNNAGFRKLPGTSLKNSSTGETIYTPPQDFSEINRLMSNLEKFMNDPSICDYDPIVKMAIIHYQFESIHPFYDGNGRTGRIINILYLIIEKLQNLPILYLSNYIIENKSDYYRLLQQLRDDEDWEEWLLFMIHGIEKTSRETIELIIQIKELMMNYKHKLRDNYKFYSQDLLNNLFKHPYTKIEFIVTDLKVSRITAANYLNKLAEDGLLKKERIGTGNYYVNEPLFNLLSARSNH
ncbi:MAG TPA: Fic family protein [Prolixibacteraceae bacterium]|nr:Fic family protein [Prolixibacteraceae bacterium]